MTSAPPSSAMPSSAAAATVRRVLHGLFLLSVVLFPFGYAFVVAGPLLCLPPLLFLYWKDWRNCTLRRLPAPWLPLLFFAAVVVQLLGSQWPARSWAVLSPNLLRGFVMPFIALECVRTEQDLRRIGVAFFLAAFGQGLDGIWQYVTGYDFIKHTAIMGTRLTGSFGTYRVGDYMGLILAPACLAGLLLPVKSVAVRVCATLCLSAPGLFLWVFAQARMGYLALTLGLCLALLSVQERFPLRAAAGLLGVFVLLVLFGPDRISLERALADPRGELWAAAWQTFLHTPWFGTGIGSFIPALRSVGLTLPINGFGVQHPHNAYLQFLVDGGLVGFAAMTTFLFGFTFWARRRIRAGVLAEKELAKAGKSPGFFWRSTLFFLAGWFGYLIILAGGHDFYRTWFFSTGMTLLGITAGACLNGPKDFPTPHPDRPWKSGTNAS